MGLRPLSTGILQVQQGCVKNKDLVGKLRTYEILCNKI
jgi:hypothetical protein